MALSNKQMLKLQRKIKATERELHRPTDSEIFMNYSEIDHALADTLARLPDALERLRRNYYPTHTYVQGLESVMRKLAHLREQLEADNELLSE